MGDEDQKTLLLVEDASSIAPIGKGILEKYGYKIVTADSGVRAVEMVEAVPGIDLILMDIVFSEGMDGREASEIILGKRNIPIIFVSSHTEREMIDRIEGIPSYGFVVKGSGENVLIASVKMALKLFESNQKALATEIQSISAHQQALLAAIPDIVTEVDNNKIITWTNPAGLSFFGEDVIGREASYYFEGEQDTYNSVTPLFEGIDNTIYVESWQRRRDGEKRLLAWWCRVLKGNDGNVCGAISTARDITEQKQMELAFKKEYDLRKISEERLSLSLEVSNAGIWEWDVTTNKVSFDAGFHRMLGYDPGEFPSTWNEWLLYHHPDDIPAMTSRAEEYLRGHSPHYESEHRIRSKNGNWNWVFTRGKTVSFCADGSPKLFIGIAMNNTAIVQAEQALRESEKKYRQIIENMNSGVFITTLTGILLHVNNMVIEMAGYDSAETMMAQPAESFYADIAERRRLIDNLLRHGSIKNLEMQLLKKDGTRFWISMNAILLPGIGDRPDTILGIINDITDRKTAEENIRSLLAEKELLLKEVHHRIKNNMNTMMSLLALQMVGQKEPSTIESLEDVRRRMQSMSLLYDKLYRAKSLKELSIRDYLSPLVNELITIFPGGSDVTIEEHIDEFILDAKRLQTIGIIVNELLTNIMKYAFVGRDDGKIEIYASETNRHVFIAIQDNGIGIPESLNSDNSTGFGFKLVKILTEQLEGTITYHEGNGTRVEITFGL